MDPRKRLGHTLVAGAAVALLVVLGGASCNMGVPNYTITVSLSEGVTGTPPTGEYVYKEMSQVRFSYTGVNPDQTIEVFLNGKFRYESTGAIILYGNGYVLTARKVDLRGDWDVTMIQGSPAVTPLVKYNFTLTLVGADELSGVFADSRGFHGTWQAKSGIVLLSYTDWFDFALGGGVYSMAGTFAGNSTTGTWNATKKIFSATSAIRSGT
jgi:hypothetical protein